MPVVSLVAAFVGVWLKVLLEIENPGSMLLIGNIKSKGFLMATRSTELNLTPAALVSHTMIRIQGDQDGDIAVYHACSPNARLRLQWGGMLMTMLSAQAIQGVLEGFSAARSAMALDPPPDPGAAHRPPQTRSRCRLWPSTGPAAPPMRWCPARSSPVTAHASSAGWTFTWGR